MIPLITAAGYAIQLLEFIPVLIQAGRDVSAFIQEGRAALMDMQATGRDPTPAEWSALNAKIDALRKDLHS